MTGVFYQLSVVSVISLRGFPETTKHLTNTGIMKNIFLLLIFLQMSPTFAVTLWSTPDSFLGPGKFYGPGAYTQDQELFPVVIRNMIFVSKINFVTPFFNNGGAFPNIRGELEFEGSADGKLSNGTKINENVDSGMTILAGLKLLPAIIEDGHFRGEQVSVTREDNTVIMVMDLAIDMGIGERGVIKLPFYGTTGTVTVPYSLQTQMGEQGVDQAGILKSGTKITGRIGDFNGDGWIDGTLVGTGTFPLDSIVYPGQPYAMQRHFETNILIKGTVFGDPKLVDLSYK